MKKLFNEQMSSNEARLILFKEVENKTKAEIEEIMVEYDKIISIITKRELELAEEGWCID